MSVKENKQVGLGDCGELGEDTMFSFLFYDEKEKERGMGKASGKIYSLSSEQCVGAKVNMHESVEWTLVDCESEMVTVFTRYFTP